jgi:adenine-specific DNA-methyltransferase
MTTAYHSQYWARALTLRGATGTADQWVFEILSEKFRLFDGVFGASDEVLGALESGVDIERRIALVYQTCRNTEEIKAAFDKLQSELDEQIQARMAQTRVVLLENLDEDVSARLRVHRDKTLESLGERERWLLELTRTKLNGHAKFEPERPRFQYTGPHARQGWYHFDWKEAEKNGDTFYRQDHPLAARVIQEAIARNLPSASLRMDYGKLMLLPAAIEGAVAGPILDPSSIRQTEVQSRLKQVEERNGRFFDEEVLKLDRWSDDLKQGLEREIKELDRQIREARKTSALAALLKDKLEAQKTLKSLEGERNRKRRELFDAQDAIDGQRDELIERIEGQLHQTHAVKTIFLFRWRLA